MWRNDYYNITSHGNYCKCHKFHGGTTCHCSGSGYGYSPWYYHPMPYYPWLGWPHPHWHGYSWPHPKPPFNPYHKPPFFHHKMH